MRKNFTPKTGLIILIAAILSSCSSSTLIQSYPTGAKVYLDGQPVGITPYWLSDTKIIGSITNVDLVKPGYEPFYTSICRDESVDLGAIVGGFICGIPFLWTLGYQPTHNYELLPLVENLNEMNDSVAYNNQQNTQIQNAHVSTKAERLKELKQLLEEKLITNDDFERQKQKILDEK